MTGHYATTMRGQSHPAEAEQLVRLGELVKRVHVERLNARSIAERVRFARETFEASIAELVAKAKGADLYASEAEADLRALALTYHEAHPEQRVIVANAVEVKQFAVYDYDAGVALEWAKARGMCLSLDRRAFDALAKQDSLRPAFVTARSEPRVQLATDLERALRALETEEARAALDEAMRNA